jgi:gliding motility-associated-like protein
MKTRIFGLFVLLVNVQWLCGQESPSAVRLNSGEKVTNAIIYENSGHNPLSEGVLGNYSASDLVMSGTENVILSNSPFVGGRFRIDASSRAFNSGTTDGLRVSDTLDLDGNPRLWCCYMDIGAFEFYDLPTATTRQPQDVRTVVGASPVLLTVDAEGKNLRYQWQHHGLDLPGQTSETLELGGHWADTGVYRVIVYGTCCNDTSVEVNVKYDPWLLTSGGECPEEESWAKIWVGGPDYEFLWSTGSQDSVITGFKTDRYTVKITDLEGRFTTLDSVFHSFLPIQIKHSISHPNNEICDNGSIRITILDTNYSHDFEWLYNNVYLSFGKDLNDVPFGDYRLLIERETHRYCASDTFNFTLQCRYKFPMESTFISPNGDGLNDVLNIKNIGYYPKNTVTIVNSFGEVVFKIKNYDNDKVVWDGRNRNRRPVPDGTYYYVVHTNNLEALVGWVIKKTAK